MKGTEHLIACRLRGMVPKIVVLHLAGEEFPKYDAEWYLRADPDEDMERADLRCLVGLRVVVHGPLSRPDAVVAAGHAVWAAKPRSVLGYASDKPKLENDALVYAEGDFSWLN